MKPRTWLAWLGASAASLLLAFPAVAIGASPAPAGWSRAQAGPLDVYQPGDLAADETFTIVVHPAGVTGGRPLSGWLESWAADKIPGTTTDKLVAEAGQDGRSATAQVMFRDGRGAALLAMFVAVSLDGERVRAMRIVATPKPALFARQKPAIGTFVEMLAREEAAAYRAAPPAAGGSAGARGAAIAGSDGRGDDASGSGTHVQQQARLARDAAAGAGVPRGSRVGGPFRHGTYDFEFPLPAINQVRRYRISFYENGEWRKEEGKSDDDSTFTYDPTTGAVQVSVTLNLYNSSYDEADFCRFYVAPDGRAFIYAEDEYGVGTHRITGRYVGPNARPSPSAEKQAKAAARAEAERFKWVTAPGRGVAADQVVAVLYRLEQVYGIGGLDLRETAYLLLRDGSAYEGLRCPPDQLDVLASRKREPLNWGRWRRAGAGYELQLPQADGTPGRWGALPMTTQARPAASGERLQGRYQRGSSFQIPGGAGSVSYLGITFTGDGRFETDFFSMVGGSTGFGDQRITAGAVANDDGAVSSVSGPNFGGGSRRKSDRPKNERTGRYQLDGYTLLLQFDDGKVERLPFFFTRQGRDGIWFRDAAYTIPKK